jgi:DNA-binding NarL/FixJ family response regulator
VSTDALGILRITDACSRSGIDVLERASDVAGLTELTARSDAIVLAGRGTMDERRALIRAACERFPGVPGVVIAPASTNGVHKAIWAGASGVVLDSDIAALPATIRAVCAGQAVVPHHLRRHASRPALSHREKQTLALAASGMTNRQIATRLFLAESTVKTHMTSIFEKLGVGSRSEAAAVVLDPDERHRLGMVGLQMARSVAEQDGVLSP